MHKAKVLFALVIVAGVVVAFSSSFGFERYRTGSNGSCAECHSGFVGGFGNPLHNLHLEMTNTCLLCHTSIGDIPRLNASGSGVGCMGCHTKEGLRLHHMNAGVGPGSSGLTCAQCHPDDATPAPESALPEYYTRLDVNVSDPCATDTGVGGEDYSTDGEGLDNDGDLAYELDDSDCTTAVKPSTWGGIKKSYLQ